MTPFLLRRLANSLILVVIATSMAYLLAATALKPRANYDKRRPKPPAAVIDRKLDSVNLNDKTPILTRFGTWASGVAHADFGRTWDDSESVTREMWRRMGTSLRLLLIATIIGSGLGVLAGAWSAVNQYRWDDHAVTDRKSVV